MSRQKTRFDHGKALKMLSDGILPGQVAKECNVSRQAIYNLLDKQNKNTVNGSDMKTGDSLDLNIDKLEEWLISRIETAREVDHLRNQLAATRNALDVANEELVILREKDKERRDREQRFLLARQQGELGG